MLPITIFGGYLGAGKTTMVNHLLRNADGLRLAVLVNEFGELPIDEDLIEAQEDNIISIAGGCICCSYGNDLVQGLLKMGQMDPKPDHILLEASGVAIPGAIGGAVGLLNGLSVDGIVVLADCETVRRTADDKYMGDTVLRQLSDADIIILNKSDLVSERKLRETQNWLSEQQPAARIVAAEHCRLPPETVLESFLDRDHIGASPHNTNLIEAVVLKLEHAVDVERLAQELAKPELGLIRAKGFATAEDGITHLIQIVGNRCQVTPVKQQFEDGIVCLGLKGQFNRSDVLGLVDAAGRTQAPK